jgi:hypothetical protein
LQQPSSASLFVPHSSIFERAEDLPTFNSAAIQANIGHIPGVDCATLRFLHFWSAEAARTVQVARICSLQRLPEAAS